jgi:putative thioredoxin
VIIDVSDASFATEVLERSKTTPVVVDFWAAWCGPCRSLGPILEQAVEARGGEVLLAKVDVDANPGLARQFGIRGIPAVKAFRDGRVVAEFVGAQPRTLVDRFLDGLLPSAADRLAASGDEASLRAAIEADPGHAGSRIALARILLGRGETEAALELLSPVEHDPAAAGIIARTRLAALDGSAPPTATAALRALDAGDTAAALAALVETVRLGSGETRELARRLAVGLFSELGDADPLTADWRPRLAAALY